MTLSVWQRTIVNDSGDVLGSATVTVRRESDNALATLYDNPAGSGSPLSNPLTADSAGFAQFYVIAGVYRITAASGSFSAVWRHVQLGTAQSVEADQNLRTTDTATFAGLWVDDVTIDGSTIGTATGEDLTISPQGDVIIPANVDVTGDVTVAGDITFTGALDIDNLRLDGSTISTTTTGDNLELAPLSGVLTVDGDVVPKTDGTSDLGSPSLEWENLYIDGIASIDSLVADTADIDGGTIDNTVIGGTIAAAGTFTSVDTEYVDFALGLSPSVTPAEGRVWFNSEETGGTLYIGMAGGNVNQPIGEAQYFWVKASSAITKGQVVMASGVVGASGKIEGAPATGLTADTNLRIIGVAAENIALNDWGLVTSFGYVGGINTNAFNANDILYFDPSVAGGLTNAVPAAPSARVIVALCIVKGSGNGQILVRLTHERALGDGNTNVQISGLGADHFLVYDNDDSRWENKTPADARTALGLGTIATQDASNVTITGGTINGTSVGASSASSGAFTTLSATGDVTIPDKIIHAGDTNTAIRFPAADTVTIETNGSERVRVDSSGNVGIGTAAPAVNLDVARGSEGEYLRVGGDNAANGRALRFTSSTGGASNGALHTINAASAEGAIALATAGTERLRINSNGNVGIGTTSPGAKLSVDGSAVFNESGADVDFRIESDTNTHAFFLDAGNSRVGINNSTPSEALDVTGDAAVSGNATFGTIANRTTATVAPDNLFRFPFEEDTIGFVGPNFEITEVECVADVSDSLAGTYFRVYGPAGTDTALDTVAGEEIIDIWFEVSSSGTEPASGADRYIQVDITTDDTAATIATTIATTLASDAGLYAASDGAGKVYIVAKTPENFTAATAGDSGFTVSTTQSGSGTLSGGDKWYGGVLAPNGKIYGIPRNSTSVLVIDPATDTASTFGTLSGSFKWIGGVLAPNGKIYGIPRDSTSVLVIDPATDTASTFGTLSGSFKWIGGVLAPNGKIYGIPYNSTSVLVIDPATDTASTFGTLSGSFKWIGGVLAPNGKIYGIPRDSTSVLVIDPATNTTSTFGTLSGSTKWIGGVLAPNGKIYGIPLNSTSVLVIDPATNTTSTFGSLTGSNKWHGSVLAPNGKIYGIPFSSTSVLVIDPATNTTSTFGSLAGSAKWVGGVLAPNGKIYGIPYSSTSVLTIDGGAEAFPSWYLSAYTNKF
jgi:hypothetical protein